MFISLCVPNKINSCANTCVRDSLDWECVWRKASEIVDDLAHRTPELKDLVLKPGGPMNKHNVFPIGFRYNNKLKSQLSVVF